jgi:hypothetical protein
MPRLAGRAITNFLTVTGEAEFSPKIWRATWRRLRQAFRGP